MQQTRTTLRYCMLGEFFTPKMHRNLLMNSPQFNGFCHCQNDLIRSRSNKLLINARNVAFPHAALNLPLTQSHTINIGCKATKFNSETVLQPLADRKLCLNGDLK